MKWIEVITLRFARLLKESVVTELLRQVEQAEKDENLVEIKMYHHATVENDLSIHIHWESEAMNQLKSSLGLQLVHALHDFGLINHSVWIDKKQ